DLRLEPRSLRPQPRARRDGRPGAPRARRGVCESQGRLRPLDGGRTAPAAHPERPGRVERARLIERTRAGLTRARRPGTRLGGRPVRLTPAQLASVAALSVREAARQLGVSVNTYRKARRGVYQQTPAASLEKPAQNDAA